VGIGACHARCVKESGASKLAHLLRLVTRPPARSLSHKQAQLPDSTELAKSLPHMVGS